MKSSKVAARIKRSLIKKYPVKNCKKCPSAGGFG